MTWYSRSYADNVAMTNMNMRADPSTSYPGRSYRFYRGETVYPFGYGLSYSLYVHHLIKAPTHLQIPINKAHTSFSATDGVCNKLTFDVDIIVTNIGKMSGSHTVLLYSYPPQVIHNSPHKQLLDFKKVQLGPWNHTSVSFKIDVCKQMSVVDKDGNRKVALGRHVLQIGDLKHNISLKV
ncbi:putative glycosidase [Helianthus annuus]|nr:putative glycosidase [Helianthus annuus]